MTGRKAATVEERFWEKVDRSGDCWVWTANKTAGYGRFRVGKRQLRAHRWAYERFVGPIPEGLQLDHLCMNTSCVNPDHLEPVTGAENTRRWAQTVTHCPRGHAYDEENTRRSNGARFCRACGRLAYHQRKVGE